MSHASRRTPAVLPAPAPDGAVVRPADLSLDALLPPAMAGKAEEIGVKKAHMPALQMFALAVLAGAFIALGGMFATTVAAGAFTLSGLPAGGTATMAWPAGVQRLLSGVVFTLGLILVVVAGAELFTGNNLIVMAWASRKVSTGLLLRNWGIVYLGNFAGAVATAGLMLLTRQYTFSGGAIGLQALTTANAKCGLEFVQAAALGIMCNALVCLAVWLTYSARTTTDKIAAMIFPISAFVAAGFEHSVANMYFIPLGMMIKALAPASFWAQIARTPADFAALTPANFLVNNLLPVTIGNVVGGGLMVGAAYWFIYLRGRQAG
jgi:formate/nitrite transporter